MIYPADLNEVFTYGKYDGASIEEVVDDNVGYITWCIENIEGFELTNEAFDYYESYL